MKLSSKNIVYLIQTDTTAGFLSLDKGRLSEIKSRESQKSFLACIDSFYKLCEAVRIPKKFKRAIRLSSKASYVYSFARAFRVVKDDSSYRRFLSNFNFIYSTSANISTKPFNLKFAFDVADIIIIDKRGIFDSSPSSIYKIKKGKIKKIR